MAGPSNTSELPDSLLEEAQQWMLKLHSGEMGQADIDALMRWRMGDEAHRRAFAEASLRWDVASDAARSLARKQNKEILYLDALRAKRQQMTRRAVLGGVTGLAAAASAAYAVFDPPLGLWPSFSEFLADYRTETGERRQLTLAGNVSVEMNTQTSLSVGASPAKARQIELIAGEIVVTAQSSAFVVNAGVGRTTAIHAAFDLRREGSVVSVVCLDGTIKIECPGGITNLQPHQKIVYDAYRLSGIDATDTSAVEAWRRGLLVFENQPLSEVIDEINRYRRGRIILLNADLGRLPLDATFRLDRIDEAVPKIAHVFGAKVRSLPGGVVFLS